MRGDGPMTVRPIGPTNRTVAVVGGGPAAHRLVEALLARGDDLRVSVFTEEPRAPYDRVALSRRFLDATDDLPLGSGPWDDPRVSLRTGCRVTAIDPAARSLTTADGSTL